MRTNLSVPRDNVDGSWEQHSAHGTVQTSSTCGFRKQRLPKVSPNVNEIPEAPPRAIPARPRPFFLKIGSCSGVSFVTADRLVER